MNDTKCTLISWTMVLITPKSTFINWPLLQPKESFISWPNENEKINNSLFIPPKKCFNTNATDEK